MTQRLPRLIAGSDMITMARITGVLYVCGGLLVAGSLLFPRPEGGKDTGLLIIAVAAATVGFTAFFAARRFRPPIIHATLALASALVSLSIYFSNVGAGVYAFMFVWVVLVAASFASVRALTLQILWLLGTYGATLIALGPVPGGYSHVTRWILTAFVLSMAGFATWWLVAGRRAAELELQREIDVRKTLQRELEYIANHDHLTGVGNRRRLQEDLARELADARAALAPLSLVVLDIDGFKDYNDGLGHASGDRLLKAAVNAWMSVLRSEDRIARAGGDEFVVLLPDCPRDQAEAIAERLRSVVPLGQTCSTGVASWNGEETAEALLARADLAMYEIKRARGRQGPTGDPGTSRASVA